MGFNSGFKGLNDTVVLDFYSSSSFTGTQTVPCALESTQSLKVSTRIFLGVKTPGA